MSRRATRSSELLVAMAILLIVVGGLTQLMVSGTKAQSDMSKRFEAQQNARLALDKLRREMHCASDVKQMDGLRSGDAATYSGIRITLGAYCRNGGMDVIWCTRTTAGVIELYRIASSPVGATCVGGTRWASYLVSGNVFSYASPPARRAHDCRRRNLDQPRRAAVSPQGRHRSSEQGASMKSRLPQPLTPRGG